MRIRYILFSAYGNGGTIRTVLDQAGAMLERGHDVKVVTVNRRRKHAKLPAHPDLEIIALADYRPSSTLLGRNALTDKRVPFHKRPVRELRRRRNLRLSEKPSKYVPEDEFGFSSYNAYTDLRLQTYLTGLDADIVVGTRPGINQAICMWAPESVLKVGQEHLNRESLKPLTQAMTEQQYPKLDLFVTLTEADAESYRRVLGAKPFVTSMPNAVPNTNGLLTDHSVKRIIAAGRVKKQKAFWRLIEAFSLIADEFPEWRVDIYGSGEQEIQDRWQMRIDDNEMNDRICFQGYTSEVHEEMAKSSIFVMSSLFEGFPMVMLEAMQIGLPVVSYDFPTGPRDLIEPGVNGVLVPEKDVDLLADALRAMILDEDGRRAMGAAARETAKRYQPGGLSERWEKLFEERLAIKRG